MANSTYTVLEYRVQTHPDRVEIYILINNPTDFMEVGGWYKRSYPKDIPSLDMLELALMSQEYLADPEWTREAPAEMDFLQREVEELRRQRLDLHMELAQLRAMVSRSKAH